MQINVLLPTGTRTVDLDELKELARQGVVQPSTLLETGGQRGKAKNVPALKPIFAELAAAPTQAPEPPSFPPIPTPPEPPVFPSISEEPRPLVFPSIPTPNDAPPPEPPRFPEVSTSDATPQFPPISPENHSSDVENAAVFRASRRLPPLKASKRFAPQNSSIGSNGDAVFSPFSTFRSLSARSFILSATFFRRSSTSLKRSASRFIKKRFTFAADSSYFFYSRRSGTASRRFYSAFSSPRPPFTPRVAKRKRETPVKRRRDKTSFSQSVANKRTARRVNVAPFSFAVKRFQRNGKIAVERFFVPFG